MLGRVRRSVPRFTQSVGLLMALGMATACGGASYEDGATDPPSSFTYLGSESFEPANKRKIVPDPDDPPPEKHDCQGHFERCMESWLSRKRGGRWGHSVCQDCRDRCKAEGRWPDETYDGKDCQWWNYPPKKKKR